MSQPLKSTPCCVLASLILNTIVAAAAYSTPVRWEVDVGGNGHLYDVILVGSPLSWDDARAGAQSIGVGWDLVTITSSAWNVFVKSLFSSDPSFFNSVMSGTNHSGPWIGGFNVVSAMNFE